MSAGAFVISKYEASSDSGSGIYPIRVQPETLALSIATVDNDPPAGAVNQRVSARVSGGRRQIGMNAALVRIKFTGTPPTGYLASSTLTLPLLTPEIRSVAAYGATGTYLGVAIQVIGTTSEKVR
jgi:hypothetical protein